jgi:iron complex outermembrane recepter protein
LGAFAHYEINEHVEAYAEMMYNDYRSTSQIAPSGDFFNTGSVNCDNPLLSAQQVNMLCNGFILDVNNVVHGPFADRVIADTDPLTPGNQGVSPFYIGRRNTEGGGRQDDLNYQSYRTVLGLRGPINDSWDYDVSGTYARVSLARTYKNDFSVTRLNRAVNVVDTDPGPGVTATCQSVVDGTDPNCVPYNVFSVNSVSAEALAYLQIPLMQTGETIQQNVVATVSGDLGFGSPAAESNFQTAFGMEYRRDELNTTTDTSFSSGDGAGQGGPTLGLSGVTDAFEIFGEARLPLVEGAPMAELISLDLAYRFSSYASGVETDTYKLGADWAPTEDIRFRGSFARAVRAANVIELFSSQGAGLFDMADDPCDLTDPGGDGVGTASVCQAAVPLAYQVTPAQAGGGGLDSPAGQYNGLFGGNPNLAPESADTITLGFVFTPRFLEGLVVSVDYFNIEVVDTVGTVDPTLTVSDCFLEGNLSSCALITRNPGTGQLWIGAGQVSALNTNIGGVSTVGFDINADYNFEIGAMGSLGFQLIGTYLQELVTDPGAITGVQPYDCVGFFASACGTPNPEWRHRFRVSWETPIGVDLNLTWRHFAAVDKASAGFTTNGHLPVSGLLDSNFEAENYFDIAGTYSMFENTKLRFGVNNVGDNDPPISNSVGAGAGNGNTYPQVYDSLGRWVFAGVTVDF